jgi:hypothetical protein
VLAATPGALIAVEPGSHVHVEFMGMTAECSLSLGLAAKL